MDGFERGRNLEKVGMHAQDTAELFFADVRVPAENLLGDEGQGFLPARHNLPQERLSIAVTAVRRARSGVRLDARLRQGAPGVRQTDRHVPAQPLRARRDGHRDRDRPGFVDRCVLGAQRGELTADEAAMAKWWTTELQKRVVDRCLQLHGGYGYMTEYPIARAVADARVHDDLRRHDRDHEGDHREVARRVRGCT